MTIQRLSYLVLTAAVAGICMLLANPVVGLANTGSSQQITPAEDFTLDDPPPPTLTVIPAAGSAGTQIEVVGAGFTGCAWGDTELESSGSADLSAAANGQLSLFWDGVEPLTDVHLDLDADFGSATHLDIASSTSPGRHQIVSRCADDASSADFTVWPPTDPATTDPAMTESDLIGVGSAAAATDPVGDASGSAGDAGSAPPDALDAGNPAAERQPSLAEAPGTPVDAAGTSPTGSQPSVPMVSSGLLIGVLLLVGALLMVAPLAALATDGWRGPEWVEANVRAVPAASSATVTDVIPDDIVAWPPMPAVRFALHTDSGTQTLIQGDT